MTISNDPIKALVLIAHGSRQQSSNEEILQLTESLRNKLGSHPYRLITHCFLEIATPNLAQCIDDIYHLHPNQRLDIDILPYFLSSGKHVEKDIPNQLLLLQKQHPNINFKLLDYIGKDFALLNFLADSVQ